MRIKPLLFVIVLILVLPADGIPAEDILSDEIKLADLAMLWQEVNYNFVYFDKVPELNWDQSFQTFIPQVLASTSRIGHVRVLQRFVAQLHEGHTNVVPPEALIPRYGSQPQFELDVIESKPVVVNVAKSLRQTIPIGSEILSIEKVPVQEYLAKDVFPYVCASTKWDRYRRAIQGHSEQDIGMLMGETGTKVFVEFETPAGNRRSATFERTVVGQRNDWVQTPISLREIFSLRWLANRIAHIELNRFDKRDVVTEFEARLPELERANAIILDVRKNSGGNSANGFAIGSHFIDDPVNVMKWRAREHVSAFKAFGNYKDFPQYRTYAKGLAWRDGGVEVVKPTLPRLHCPVVVLIGTDTYSAAEDFSAFVSQVPHVLLIGNRTAGSTGQPLVFQLPSGSWAGITAKRCEFPDGKQIVGTGIEPHIEVHQSLKSFREGHDDLLERALAELPKKLKR